MPWCGAQCLSPELAHEASALLLCCCKHAAGKDRSTPAGSAPAPMTMPKLLMASPKPGPEMGTIRKTRKVMTPTIRRSRFTNAGPAAALVAPGQPEGGQLAARLFAGCMPHGSWPQLSFQPCPTNRRQPCPQPASLEPSFSPSPNPNPHQSLNPSLAPSLACPPNMARATRPEKQASQACWKLQKTTQKSLAPERME